MALADTELPDRERRAIVRALQDNPMEMASLKTGKPVFPEMGWTKEGTPPPPSEFISSESHLIFKILGINGSDWLESLLLLPCSAWNQVTSYEKFSVFVNNLSVTNDVAERGIALITKYMDRVSDEEERQDLLLNVNYWRKNLSGLKKSDLCDLPM